MTEPRADAAQTQETDTAYHYRLIARAIAEIDAAGGTTLPLEVLAARLGLSQAHFQRVFTRWVGVSPKRYQQYLTLDHARRLLASRHSTFDTALSLGLSGSGRLHDLFITWEAMSPGRYADRGAGLTLGHATLDTPYGPALAMATERGLAGLAFTAECGPEAGFADLAARWPAARLRPDPEAAALARSAIDSGSGRLHVLGAPFQIKVWEALMAIPSGHVATYSDIAAATGQPRAIRAAGTAIGRNPLSLLIPCHRALRKTGELGGYHWGLGVKRAMLAREAAISDAKMPALSPE